MSLWQRLITYHRALTAFLITTVFCLGIALALSAMTDSFIVSVVMSFSIGYSICAMATALTAVIDERWHRLLAFVYVPVGLALGMVIGGTLSFGNPLMFFLPLEPSTLASGVLFGLIGSVGFMALTALSQSRRQLHEQELQLAEQERQLMQSQLRVLQSQMEPHFLFNTLSNVVSLVDADPAKAKRMLELLTQLLRNSLRRARAPDATVGEELQMVTAYLQIQEVRMGDRLRYDVHCDPALRQAHIPPLLIQPLVENAVRWGIEPLEHGGEVRVDVRRDGNGLIIGVTDTGPGIDAQHDHPQPNGGGVTLPNLRERLHSLYGQRATLTLRPNVPSGTQVEVRLPFDGLALQATAGQHHGQHHGQQA